MFSKNPVMEKHMLKTQKEITKMGRTVSENAPMVRPNKGAPVNGLPRDDTVKLILYAKVSTTLLQNSQ